MRQPITTTANISKKSFNNLSSSLWIMKLPEFELLFPNLCQHIDPVWQDLWSSHIRRWLLCQECRANVQRKHHHKFHIYRLFQRLTIIREVNNLIKRNTLGPQLTIRPAIPQSPALFASESTIVKPHIFTHSFFRAKNYHLISWTRIGDSYRNIWAMHWDDEYRYYPWVKKR